MAYCLRQRRREAGLQQQKLADLAGVSRSGLQHNERGRRHPSTSKQKRLCRALGISHLELMAQCERVEQDWAKRGL